MSTNERQEALRALADQLTVVANSPYSHGGVQGLRDHMRRIAGELHALAAPEVGQPEEAVDACDDCGSSDGFHTFDCFRIGEVTPDATPAPAATGREADALREAMQPVAEWMNAGGHDDEAYERGCHAAFKLLRDHGPALVNALAAQPPTVSVDWRDGFPPLTKLDDKPCKGPDGRPIPPMRESDEVIVCTDDGRVVMDHCCAIGDGMPLWFLNARRVTGWMPKPTALNPEAPDA